MERFKIVQVGTTAYGKCYLRVTTSNPIILYLSCLAIMNYVLFLCFNFNVCIILGHHTEKLQLKPRLDGNVIEEENHKEACEPRDEAIDMNANFSAHLQEEISPQVPEKATGNSSHGWEHEERVESPSNNNVAGEEKSGRERNVRKSTRAAQKREKTSEEPNQRSEEPQKKKKKFKHSTRRQKRTCNCNFLQNCYVGVEFFF